MFLNYSDVRFVRHMQQRRRVLLIEITKYEIRYHARPPTDTHVQVRAHRHARTYTDARAHTRATTPGFCVHKEVSAHGRGCVPTDTLHSDCSLRLEKEVSNEELH